MTNLINFSEKDPFIHLASEADFKNYDGESRRRHLHRLRSQEKYRFYMHAFDFINEFKIKGDYLEFGCYQARTFRMALTEARRFDKKDMKFFAFDSFAGLPADDTMALQSPHWSAGAYAMSEKDFLGVINEHGIYPDNVVTVPGFYDKSLTSELKNSLLKKNVKASLVCVDCDLYQSAVDVFKFLPELIGPGTIIYIDEYNFGLGNNSSIGVMDAFNELKKNVPWGFKRFMDVGWWGMSLLVTEREPEIMGQLSL